MCDGFIRSLNGMFQLVAYLPFNGFTTTELSVEADSGRQIIIAPMEGEAARSFLGNFDQAWGSGELADVTDAVKFLLLRYL